MRLIDAENAATFIEALVEDRFVGRQWDGYNSALKQVAEMLRTNEKAFPTVKSEVRRGKWIEPDYVYFGAKQYICDQCKDDEFWQERYVNYKDNFCPNCGADMREVDDGTNA